MNRKRIIALLVVCLLVIGMLGACSDEQPTEDKKVVEDPQQTEDVKTEPETKMISIYGVDSETMERVALDVEVSADEKVSPQLIVSEVAGNFQEEIGISEVRDEKNRVTVCFQNGKAPLANVSSAMENIILDCIAFSVLDNVDTCTEICFEGEAGTAYESGHNAFEIGEIYATK